jgi:hypothetical protein
MNFPSKFPLDNENHAERTVFDVLKKLPCIFCHSNQDELHRQNFIKDGKRNDLDIFLSKIQVRSGDFR